MRPEKINSIYSTIATLPGIGPKIENLFNKMGIYRKLHFLWHIPYNVIKREKHSNIQDAKIDTLVSIKIKILDHKPSKFKRQPYRINCLCGNTPLDIVYFYARHPVVRATLPIGKEKIVSGKLEYFRNNYQITHPSHIVDSYSIDQIKDIEPVYTLTSGLTHRLVIKYIEKILKSLPNFNEWIDTNTIKKYSFKNWNTSILSIHNPENSNDLIDNNIFRRRLAYDELLAHQLAINIIRNTNQKRKGLSLRSKSKLISNFIKKLPFELTTSQQNAWIKIKEDLKSNNQMVRLLQGDVGSGKTLVAFQGLINAVANGHQGAFMAPTEILAEQHYMGLREMAEGFEVPDSQTLTGVRPLSIKLLSNSVPAPEKKRIIRQLKDGSVDVAVGTHSLIQSGVSFKSLSFVVIDEQHRFGVDQRAKLREHSREDGRWPHLLVMTATPIPRTAAMTVYGDLDVSVLDELPPGRIPIETKWVSTPEAVKSAWSYVREEVKGGRQTFVVCPLIDESENIVASSAEATYAELIRGELSGLRVGLLHGRLKASDKERAMEQFRVGLLDVLVATTVIEVGVNIPNASAMVVLSADRFGIAQLHQLRGRVGRSSYKSRCYLVTEDSITEDAVHRLQALENSTDGFELAEVDLELRGEGTIFDQRQSGRSDLKLASLVRDRLWVERARSCSEALVEGHGTITSNPMLGKEIEWFISARGTDAENLWRG